MQYVAEKTRKAKDTSIIKYSNTLDVAVFPPNISLLIIIILRFGQKLRFMHLS